MARALVRRARRTIDARRATRAEQAWTEAEVHGFTLALPGRFRHHYVDHDYEPLSRAFLEAHVRPGHHAVDVGAHIGLYTLLLGRLVGPDGRVTSVEPAAENLEYLRANLAGNGLDDRVEVVVAAASAAAGRARFHITGSSDSHGLFAHPNTATVRVVEVDTVRLDDIVTGADFVKIDTEGAELETIEGFRRGLSATTAALVEWAPACQSQAGHDLGDLPVALQDLGFAVRVLDDQAGVEREVGETLAGLRSGSLPAGWYGNLACSRP